ncbi:hypothetical protein P154DRAFT_21741 [Amniculicola lignicola CBS 123094]|uniref:Rhodopsin domain-containing protein n=1 Tax=Amniculicola lignicola CBS 123094 TaxID=1392246 RepID=A0A6A5WSS4_9PLEO|nr:hypothetical protein P154DRAFT_21741 [Amniculicola lignicola CBS 123094]
MTNTTQPIYSSNYLKQYNGNRGIAVCIALSILQSVFFTLRFISRYIKKVPWGVDDTLLVLAAFGCAAQLTASFVALYPAKFGYHYATILMWPDALQKLEIGAKLALVLPVTYLSAVYLIRLSIVATYLRIIQERWQRMACWIVGFLMIVACLATIVPVFIACKPLKAFWNPNMPGAKCIDFNTWFRGAGGASLIFDPMLLAIPIPVIRKLHASTKTKVALAATFATGSIGFVAGIVRFVGYFKYDVVGDASWVAVELLVLTNVELGLYFIAACLFALKPLMILIWTKLGYANTYGAGSYPSQGHVTHIRSPIRPGDSHADGYTDLEGDFIVLVEHPNKMGSHEVVVPGKAVNPSRAEESPC